MAKGPRLLLELPSACFTPVLETSMSAVFGHILEDPATLQAAMEAEILSNLASGGRARPPNAPGEAVNKRRVATCADIDLPRMNGCRHSCSCVHHCAPCQILVNEEVLQLCDSAI